MRVIKDHNNGKLVTDWQKITDQEYEEVKNLDRICFPYFDPNDFDHIRDNPDTEGDIFRLYSHQSKHIIGYAVYGQVFDDNEAYILRIGTHPKFRRNGHAYWMLDCVIIDLKSRNPKSKIVYCDIRESNQSSLNLFTKSGFNLVEVREGVFEDGELSHFMYMRL